MTDSDASNAAVVVDSTMTFLAAGPEWPFSHGPPMDATSVTSDRLSHRRP